MKLIKTHGDLKASMPVYVTRKTAGSEKTGDVSMPIGQVILAALLVYLNVLAWGLFGLIEVVKLTVELF